MEISKFKKINNYEWDIQKSGEMRVPGRIFASQKLIEEMDDKVFEQTSNVACLPGIQKASIAMADAHWGYGFPIGGVGAFDLEEGIVSVGGVGFDGGCGVRTIKTNLFLDEVKPKIKLLCDSLFNHVPVGLGIRGKIMLNNRQVNEVLTNGARWAVENNYGDQKDLQFLEDKGEISGAIPKNVSQIAIQREKNQIGTLGSGNHYLEIQYVDEIYDEKAAKIFGLEKNQIVASIHCGSRALGHQIGTDYLKVLAEASRKYKIPIREKELVCAPINSNEGQKYYSAMCCALNYAYANREVITHLTREIFDKIFPQNKLETLYEVSHNSAKIEEHFVDNKSNKKKKVLVHRKGATRAFGPGHNLIPKKYSAVGQPVIIGGSMGTESYILHGTNFAMKNCFGSSCHGAGRAMSRHAAKKIEQGSHLILELLKKGIYVRARSLSGVAEEAPEAYKDVNNVVNSMHDSGIALKVVKLKPIGNIKG
ncbi:RtcB family protein [Candidatus Pacearchaeota archaeon]|nr:RtcB family protein [Candidatus Pacearchaeota archaeon]